MSDHFSWLVLNFDEECFLKFSRKTCPYITEILLMGRKESNQTKKLTGSEV